MSGLAAGWGFGWWVYSDWRLRQTRRSIGFLFRGFTHAFGCVYVYWEGKESVWEKEIKTKLVKASRLAFFVLFGFGMLPYASEACRFSIQSQQKMQSIPSEICFYARINPISCTKVLLSMALIPISLGPDRVWAWTAHGPRSTGSAQKHRRFGRGSASFWRPPSIQICFNTLVRPEYGCWDRFSEGNRSQTVPQGPGEHTRRWSRCRSSSQRLFLLAMLGGLDNHGAPAHAKRMPRPERNAP